MKNIFRNCIYQGKNLSRDLGFLFWCLGYPLIMAIFFYTAFSGILNMELENINVGIGSQNPILFILKEVEILNIEEISDEEIEEKLNNEEIHGFIDNDLNVLVANSGINQTIMQEIVGQIKQVEKLSGSLNGAIEDIDFTIDYVRSKNQKADSMIIIFYSLIAMVSMYGVFAGVETVSLIQANLSNIGARINVTPLKKHSFLLGGFIVALFLNLLSNGILLIFIKYILKITLFKELKYSMIFIILGNVFGVALGILIGASNKKDRNVKTMMGIIITLFLSFLSGMMGPDIKVMVDKHAPILGRINPISIITNNLYRINLMDNINNVNEGIFILGAYCIVLMFISYILLRGRSYDSL